MPERKFDAGNGYRYGFNGKENDKNISEGGQDYGMRIYDGRLGKFLSVDPIIEKYPFYSPYQFSGNDVIRCIDKDGGEPESRHEDWDYHTATLSGTTYNNVYDKASHRNFDLQGVVDPTTGKLWIIADDGQGQQQYFYLINDDGATDRIRTYVENGRTVLYNSHLERFKTRNEIDKEQGAAIADGFGMAIFSAAAGISGGFAVSGTVTALTPQATLLYGIYAAPAANVVNNYVVPLLDESGQAGNLSAGFNALERSIVQETQSILNSKSLEALKAAAANGVEATVEIAGRNIHYSPDLSASAMTLHQYGEFVLGKEAFKDTKTLGHTILWELYRLSTQGSGSLSQGETRAFTDAAQNFADKAIDAIK